MKIVDFLPCHGEQAAGIARQEYAAERLHISALPEDPPWPDFQRLAENGLGVAAMEGGKMLGFLCCTGPFGNAFGSTDAVGLFSPLHANGAIGENRGELALRMYRVAGEKWARAGASSHGICFYAHDRQLQEAFFQIGFGIRCMDAIRLLEPQRPGEIPGCNFSEMRAEDFSLILPLHHRLDAHMAESPCFLLRPSATEEDFLARAERDKLRIFAAWTGREPVAFLQVEAGGETFVSGEPGSLHVTGMYCLPEYRGKGIAKGLLDYGAAVLEGEGYDRLGVDFESINPTAHRFWRKYFGIYTHSLTRRIDEYAVESMRT